ncbi:MAG: OmpA family protein [Arenimonas sp.]
MSPLTRFTCLAMLLLAALVSPANAAVDAADLPDGTDVKGASDHPQIQRFKGSSIRFSEKKAFSEMLISLSSARIDKPLSRVVEGQSTTLVYVMPKDVSTLEAIRGYQEELAKLGTVKVLFQGVNSGSRQELDNFINDFVNKTYGQESAGSKWMAWNKEYRYAALQITRPEGDMFVSIYAGMNARTSGGDYYTMPEERVGVRIDVIEPKPRVARMVTVTSTEMSAELTKNGRIALYGILFDTAKADVKPESKPSLVEIAKLMKADPKLRLMVVGHTDTQGLFEPNRDLSTRRAKAVVLALTSQYGVDGTRLQSFGASFAAPVATNASEAGRAKNRRVELVAY